MLITSITEYPVPIEERRFCAIVEIFQRTYVSLGQIAKVNIIAYARAVGCVVIGSENLQSIPPAVNCFNAEGIRRSDESQGNAVPRFPNIHQPLHHSNIASSRKVLRARGYMHQVRAPQIVLNPVRIEWVLYAKREMGTTERMQGSKQNDFPMPSSSTALSNERDPSTLFSKY
jgi:hypothetical protein